MHNCSKNKGSSGSPLILRNSNLSIIGLYHSSIKSDENSENKYSYNVGTLIISIINDIKKQIKINLIILSLKIMIIILLKIIIL